MPDGDGGKTVWAVTSLGAMEMSARESGCITCGLLSKGFRMVAGALDGLAAKMPDDGHIRDANDTVIDERWLRIEFNGASGTPSLDLFDFITSTPISVFYITSKQSSPDD